MRVLLNIIWIICGGLFSALGWVITGALWCITVLGIPVGLQCFKMASISLNPFGKEIVDHGGAGSFLLNVLWFIFGGIELALSNFLLGVICCITIIGIPLGKQYFKIAKVSLCPFGKEVIRTHVF